MVLFIIYLALNVKMNCARNYENLLNFVKVMLEILVVPFFLHVVYKAVHVYVCMYVCPLITPQWERRLPPNFQEGAPGMV